ncbi:MAG: methyltransferase domain-containing protein [Rhodobacteraceae bacterium]|nr:methyltransferase domain-containing protein [Paracoccaceae bacterium]
MKDFFDFLRDVAPYDRDDATVARLNRRHALIVEPFVPWLKGARVLDLACHDGRWSYALAAAGAAEVVGVEGRQELIDRFAHFPQTGFKGRVSLRRDDIFADLEARRARGERFDVVALYGIFYHVMDHFRLLRLVKALGPKLVIIDSEFMDVDNPMIQLVRNDVTNHLNAIPIGDERFLVVGVPSRRATDAMAESLGYRPVWVDAEAIVGDDRRGVQDYFRARNRKIRATCALLPEAAGEGAAAP